MPTVPDMVISMPMVDPVTHGWMYEVDVYAKSGPSAIVKTVSHGNAGTPGQDAPVAGQVMTHNFEATVPYGGYAAFGGACLRDGVIDVAAGLDPSGFNASGFCAEGASWSGTAGGAAFRLVDDLTTGLVPGTSQHTGDFLEFTSSTWDGQITAMITSGAGDRTLTACPTGTTTGCDYTITKTASRLQIDLTDRGMQTMAEMRAAAEDTVLLGTAQARVKPSVTELTTMSSYDLDAGAFPIVLHLPNTVLLFPDGASITSGTPSTSPIVTTRYSTLRLHKVSVEGGNLAGAVFTLYRTLADAQAGTNPLMVSEPTNQLGLTQFPGLQVTDFQNNAGDDDSYWVVETTTPAGYVGLVGPFEVKLTSDGITVSADESGGYPVVNSPEGYTPPGPETTPQPGTVLPPLPNRPGLLPATGVALALSTVIITAMLTLGGGAGMAGIFARFRRRSED